LASSTDAADRNSILHEVDAPAVSLSIGELKEVSCTDAARGDSKLRQRLLPQEAGAIIASTITVAAVSNRSPKFWSSLIAAVCYFFRCSAAHRNSRRQRRLSDRSRA
jgi:hypothetical protein